jgi:hypothetical protein
MGTDEVDMSASSVSSSSRPKSPEPRPFTEYPAYQAASGVVSVAPIAADRITRVAESATPTVACKIAQSAPARHFVRIVKSTPVA